MEKSVGQLRREHSLLWVTLSNCHTVLSIANEGYLPEHVRPFVEMALEEARLALDKTAGKEPKNSDE